MGLCTVAGCPQDARHRFACDRCTERIRNHLREIERYAAIIAHTKTRGRGGDGGRRAPGFGSRSPADDSKIAADDYRSRSTGDGPDDIDGDVLSMLGTIHAINEWIRENLDQPPRAPRTLTSEIGWLLGQVDFCATRPWVADIADNVRELHAQTRRLSRDSPPGTVGNCLATGCPGKVYPALVDNPADPYGPRVDGGRCSTCREPYDWLRLIDLRQATMRNEAG